MRLAACLAFLLFALPAPAEAQGLMRLYRMAYGISGYYGNGGHSTDIAFPGATTGSDMEHEYIRLTTRNGYFVSRNFLLGVEFNWDQAGGELRPDPNPDGYRLETYERRIFIGPLLRWYQPMTPRWFLYPEFSFGYTHYLEESEEFSLTANALPTTTTARGFGVNAGAGIGYFLTRHVVFDAALRYMHAWRSGEYEVPASPDREVDMTEHDIQLFFGFQLLI
ncbi:MAG: outer membrane beta-barrel protein [Bacteroidota bacterium]|nr:outer membrane beta-barrel protein [Bacteroidota bacterium]